MTASRSIRFIACIGVLLPIAVADGSDDETRLVETIELVGGKVVRDESRPQPHVVAVDFRPKFAQQRTRFSEKYLHLLSGFRRLSTLILTNTTTTDAALPEITRLTNLKVLHIGGTRITDAGLLELKELKNLAVLDLWEKSVSDAELKRLNLQRFKAFQLTESRFTQKGIRELKKHLPALQVRQPPLGLACPNQLDLGTVGVRATVEASVRVFFADRERAEGAVHVSPPSFLRVLRVETGKQAYGQLGAFVFCDVFVSVDTASVGRLNGVLKVTVRENEIEVPISAHVRGEISSDSTRVLIVDSPFTRFSSSDDSIFDPWRNLVTSADLDVQYLEAEAARPVLRDIDLSDLDVILLGCGGLVQVQEADLAKLNKFIESGGRVVVAANHFYDETVHKANQFLVPLGLKMNNVERQIDKITAVSEVAPHPLTERVENLKFYRPSPISVEDANKGILLVETDEFPGQGLVAIAQVGKGEVVAVGISLWWNWIASPEESGADNVRLLQNLLTRPKTTTRSSAP